ncbi:hypothetical protein H2200_010805 [Cladophialophora chaetospira]|uniref:Major facilitator superfamily (MFS) profile domain-containing protein n=1 Tax=Cladophialophora chaetospira TaxID=386627 RepID=A0AA38X0T5_9EURO|nr:hypothetical protein H2200_010805 [Cladophialophora chaetospira]
MSFLSLHEVENTQGTVQLIDHGGNLQVKAGTDIVLIPQPNTNDPNDPLTWPLKKRTMAYYSILMFSGLTNFGISGISPGFEQLAEEFHVSINQLTYLISVKGLGMAMGCFTIAPFSVRYGKRPVWLCCMTGFFVCHTWAAASKSYASLLVARLLASWFGGMSEPLSLASLNDLFFLHERGTQNGIQALSLSIGNAVAPIVSGFLIESRGWRWYHWLVVILAGVNWLLIFFLYPETAYARDLHRSMDAAAVTRTDVEDKAPKQEGDSKAEFVTVETSNPATSKRKTFIEGLKPWSGVWEENNLLAAYIRPWVVWVYPSFVWGALAFALHVSVIIILISLLPIELGGPPYHFSVSQLGLTYIAQLIGNLIGCYSCGYLNDVLSQWSARRNDGIFEPEMRLPVIMIPAIFGPAGILMFGIGVVKQVHWIVPVIGDAFLGVALTGLPSVVQPYLMDCYYPVSMDALIAFNGMKNFIFFGIGFAVVPWVELNGLIAVSSILAEMLFVVDSLAIVVHMFGKPLRVRDGKLKIFPF